MTTPVEATLCRTPANLTAFLQADFFSMLSSGRRGGAGGAERAARGQAATGPHVAVARELLDLIEFSIGALRRQVRLIGYCQTLASPRGYSHAFFLLQLIYASVRRSTCNRQAVLKPRSQTWLVVP